MPRCSGCVTGDHPDTPRSLVQEDQHWPSNRLRLAGVAKAIAAFQRRAHSGSPALRQRQPHIDRDHLALKVPDDHDAVRGATVDCWPASSSGFSGTNAHVIPRNRPASSSDVPFNDRLDAHLRVVVAIVPRSIVSHRYQYRLADESNVADLCFQRANAGWPLISSIDWRSSVRPPTSCAGAGAAPDVPVAAPWRARDSSSPGGVHSPVKVPSTQHGRRLYETSPEFRSTLMNAPPHSLHTFHTLRST